MKRSRFGANVQRGRVRGDALVAEEVDDLGHVHPLVLRCAAKRSEVGANANAAPVDASRVGAPPDDGDAYETAVTPAR